MAMINYADKVALNSNSGIADINKCNATDMNEIKSALNNYVQTGWYTGRTGTTYAFVSWNSTTKIGIVSTSQDVTSLLSVGMKVRFVQNATTKYGIIVAITSTQITLFMGTDYTLTNGGITDAYYSIVRAPHGFPMDPNKWSLKTQFSNQINSIPAQSAKTLASIIIPIGVWDIIISGYSSWYSTAGQVFDGRIGLNTTQDTEPKTLGLALSFLDTINSIGVVRTNTSFSYLNYITTIQTTLYWNIFMYLPTATYNGVTSCWCWVKCAYL